MTPPQENPGKASRFSARPVQGRPDRPGGPAGSPTSSWSLRGRPAPGSRTSGGAPGLRRGFPPRCRPSRCPAERHLVWGWGSGEGTASGRGGRHWSGVSSRRGTLVGMTACSEVGIIRTLPVNVQSIQDSYSKTRKGCLSFLIHKTVLCYKTKTQ